MKFIQIPIYYVLQCFIVQVPSSNEVSKIGQFFQFNFQFDKKQRKTFFSSKTGIEIDSFSL
jgi:hypothetical protein